MNALSEVAPAFVEMAHRIVWCSAATVDAQGWPRSRILHPIWQGENSQLVGWIATRPTPTKRAHLKGSPDRSANADPAIVPGWASPPRTHSPHYA